MLSRTYFSAELDISTLPFFHSVTINVNRKFIASESAWRNRFTFRKGLNEIGFPFSKV